LLCLACLLACLLACPGTLGALAVACVAATGADRCGYLTCILHMYLPLVWRGICWGGRVIDGLVVDLGTWD
jgi:hypothetical protein